MELIFECPHCHGEFQVPSNLANSDAECPDCGEEISIPPLRLGPRVIVGGFRLEKHLGKGSMGDVYLATQLSMGRKVAIKLLPQAMTVVEESVNRFLHEVQTSAKMEHPNIVTAFDAGQDTGTYYLAMSYVEGEDFDERVRRDGPVPERLALQAIRDVTRGLKYAWVEHRLLHRDIKPGNIMIDRHGTIKLMDLGISKSMHDDASLTMPGLVVGTPHYMSPEQAWSEDPIDFRSDLYGLGATLFMLLTGRPPYVGTSQGVFTMLIKPDPYPHPQSVNPNISDETTQLIETMMASDPNARQQSWDELLEEIERVLAGQAPLRPAPVRTDASAPEPPPLPPGTLGANRPPSTGSLTLGPVVRKGGSGFPGSGQGSPTRAEARRAEEDQYAAGGGGSADRPSSRSDLSQSKMAVIEPKKRDSDAPKLSLNRPGGSSGLRKPSADTEATDTDADAEGVAGNASGGDENYDPSKTSVLRLKRDGAEESKTPSGIANPRTLPPVDDKPKKKAGGASIAIAVAIIVVGLSAVGGIAYAMMPKQSAAPAIVPTNVESTGSGWDTPATLAEAPVEEVKLPDVAPAVANTDTPPTVTEPQPPSAEEQRQIQKEIGDQVKAELAKADVDEEAIAKGLGFPYPVEEPGETAAALNAIVKEKLGEIVDKRYPPKDFTEDGEKKYGAYSVGDTVQIVYKSQGELRQYRGTLYEIGKTRVRVGDLVVPMVDLEEETRDRLDPTTSNRKVKAYVAEQQSAYDDTRSKYADRGRDAVAKQVFEHYGYVQRGDQWVSQKSVFDQEVDKARKAKEKTVRTQVTKSVYTEHGYKQVGGKWVK